MDNSTNKPYTTTKITSTSFLHRRAHRQPSVFTTRQPLPHVGDTYRGRGAQRGPLPSQRGRSTCGNVLACALHTSSHACSWSTRGPIPPLRTSGMHPGSSDGAPRYASPSPRHGRREYLACDPCTLSTCKRSQTSGISRVVRSGVSDSRETRRDDP
jgi:hypothetical protein